MNNPFDFFTKREAPVAPSSEGGVPDKPKTGTFGSNIVNGANEANALSVAAFYRAVELRASTMSQLVCQYQKLDKLGGNFVEDTRGEGGHINYLLQVRPNPLMNWPVLMRQAEIARMLQGNAVIYIERDSTAAIKAFWLCSSASLNIATNKYTVTFNGIKGPEVKSDIEAVDVLHIKNTFSENYGLTGVGILKYGAQVMTLAATNDKLVKDNAAKGGKLKLILQEEKSSVMGISGRAKKSELEKVATNLQNDIYDKDVVLLNNLASVTPISQNMQQQEIQLARQFSVSEIERLTGTIGLLGSQGSQYKDPVQATLDFKTRTIGPAVQEWEAELNGKLLGPAGYTNHRYHLCEQELMRMDPQSMANIDKLQLETGVKSVNEIRASYDLPKIEGGDLHYISTNLAELGSEKLRKPASVEGATHSTQEGEKGDEQ